MSEKVLAYIIIVGFTAPVCFLICWAVLGTPSKDIRRWYWRIRFRRTFGLWPSKDALEKKILHVVVERVLFCLAAPYKEWCDKENILGAKYVVGVESPDIEPLGDLSELRQIRKNLARAKRQFLGARATAKEHSFAVRDTHQDYLEKEVER